MKNYKKLFYDLEKARQFGNEVEYIASQTTVQTGKRTFSPIFSGKREPYTYVREGISNHLIVGDFHCIDEEKGRNGQSIYYVRYSIPRQEKASKADMIDATRRAEAYLNEKYRELGPDAGMSRT